ncbi:probable aldehyde dehydrogenase-like [Stylonychia lemnae]|uniref:Probable aldehyde dehydrogenase-like n=1 Tax=Stylonychia lemnae TaxID=5949 RepID=A0A078ANG5_STYLE|nr:probable aldehyde dehydrogenase-like [Stylonychia lemnae]|eukprot:CDW82503.1 probable aldehyde dehydrogenase-like [Stylonychia lemnae]
MFLSKTLYRNIHLIQRNQRQFSNIIKAFATVDPNNLSKKDQGLNLVNGVWSSTKATTQLIDPMNGNVIATQADTSLDEIKPFVDEMAQTPKTGLHNPFKNKERYLMLAEVNRKLVESFNDKEVFDFFIKAIQRVCPKSTAQATGELQVTIDFFKNFCGDNVRYLASSFGSPGDHQGQSTNAYRFPYGAVSVITPFNFPLEIPVLQMMGALYMGNKVLVKPDVKTALPLEQFIRLLHHCGLPKTDLSLIYSNGPVMEKILQQGNVRQTLFTGSSKIAEQLSKNLRGKVRIEDAGFDWKILGPDVPKSQQEIDYVAWQCDQDAYGHTGQKCSAQSILFVHKNWKKTNFYDTLKSQAEKRSLEDQTIGPVLSWTNQQIQDHVDKVKSMKAAELLFGGEALQGHSIPPQYGAYKPTAIKVPIYRFANRKQRSTLLTELFGPFQVIVEYGDQNVDQVLKIMENMTHHLTAAVVSNNPQFVDKILQNTVNGTTYTGLRARTTGAPQNHWFGPSGDPRGAGIGSKEAIKLVWSHHREIISDIGPIKESWSLPDPK